MYVIKRVVAYCIDTIISMILLLFLVRFMLFITNNLDLTTQFYVVIISLEVIREIIFCFKDNVYKNQSIGKRVFKLQIYNKMNKPEKRKIVLFFRNMININFNYINIFTLIIWKKTIGDFVFGTYVE